MDARTRRLLAWIEYFVTLAAIIALIVAAYRLPAGPGVFIALIALSLSGWLIYRMVSRQLTPADWTDKYPRAVSTRPLTTNCISCGYDCTGIKEPKCPECGKPHAIPMPLLPLKERTTSCQKCRYVFAEIAGRCPECGYLIRDTPQTPPQSTMPPSGILMAGVSAVTLFLIGLSVFITFNVSMGFVLVVFYFVPAWVILMVATVVVLAVGRAFRKDFSTACGRVLLSITALALVVFIIFANV